MAATVAPFRGRGEMPRPKVAMRRIKEVLRLKEGLGLSDTAVSRSVRIARSTVKEYLDRAAAVGLNWEAVAELSEEELDRRLFAAVDTRHRDRPLPDWEAVEKELRGPGVTLRLLWLEYLSRHPDRRQLLGPGAEPQLSRARPPLQRSDCPGTGQKATGQTVRGKCGQTGRDVGAGAAAPPAVLLTRRGQRRARRG